MIILLEQDFDLFLQLNSEICLRESIKCHNNQIANYIIEKFELNDKITKDCLHYFDYETIQYDHIKLFEMLFDNDNYGNLSKLECQNGSNEIIQNLRSKKSNSKDAKS
ncbi:hypothetical protein M9Y10_001455 [Tritrichomonas musculus]|uniref:Uncharacterized protein n=1 Tax=Tritrichomonas musculus TaxID=1915356 RepID=A0ABR2L745_9EUKA